ncbi:MAG TPA: hypothetical protein DEA08_01845, partial [Planctomycetes bacterium]|nr:hypothetical protein [Planctomycetota bacterium]
MNALIAIVLDTWRQSRQQWVFLLMLLLLVVLTGAALIMPEAEEPTLKLWRGGPQTTIGSVAEPIELSDPSALATGDLDADGDV